MASKKTRANRQYFRYRTLPIKTGAKINMQRKHRNTLLGIIYASYIHIRKMQDSTYVNILCHYYYEKEKIYLTSSIVL